MATDYGKDGKHVEHISLDDAVKLLQAGSEKGIQHVVSVIRDPRDPSRILSINAAEVA
jgi:hypothetical protein